MKFIDINYKLFFFSLPINNFHFYILSFNQFDFLKITNNTQFYRSFYTYQILVIITIYLSNAQFPGENLRCGSFYCSYIYNSTYTLNVQVNENWSSA